MFETLETQVGLILSIATLLTIIVGFYKFVHKKGEDSGKSVAQKENHLTSSDETHEDLYQQMEKMDEKFDDYSLKNEEAHKSLYKKLGMTQTDVAYIKGKIDQALKTK